MLQSGIRSLTMGYPNPALDTGHTYILQLTVNRDSHGSLLVARKDKATSHENTPAGNSAYA